MNISLTPELEELVTNKVKSGRYQSASEVVREGLRLLDDHDRLREVRIAAVREKIQAGFGSLERGEGVPLDDALNSLRRSHAELRKTMGK